MNFSFLSSFVCWSLASFLFRLNYSAKLCITLHNSTKFWFKSYWWYFGRNEVVVFKDRAFLSMLSEIIRKADILECDPKPRTFLELSEERTNFKRGRCLVTVPSPRSNWLLLRSCLNKSFQTLASFLRNRRKNVAIGMSACCKRSQTLKFLMGNTRVVIWVKV